MVIKGSTLRLPQSRFMTSSRNIKALLFVHARLNRPSQIPDQVRSSGL